MSKMRTLAWAAVAALAVVSGAGRARADFSFVSTPDYATSTDQSATLNLGAASSGSGLTAPTKITFGNPTVTSTATQSETLNLPFSYTITITNPSLTGVSDHIQVTGAIKGTASSNSSNLDTIVFGGGGTTMALSGYTFTITGVSGTAPQTTNTVGTGSLVAQVNIQAVPEPASVALLALGGLGIAGVVRRRKARA